MLLDLLRKQRRPACAGMLLNYAAPAGIAPALPISDGIFGNSGSPLILGPFDFTQALDDTITLTDDLSSIVTFNLSQDDTITLSDAIINAVSLFPADTITLSDVSIRGAGLVIADTITLSDSSNLVLTIGLRLRMLLGVGT